MKIQKLINQAKDGDLEAFNKLVAYYFPIFQQVLEEKCTVTVDCEKLTGKYLPIFIKSYLEANYKTELISYLRYHANNFFETNHRHGNLMLNGEDFHVEIIKAHYVNMMSEKIKNISSPLTASQRQKLSSCIVDNFINNYSVSQNKSIFSTYMTHFINREVNYYEKRDGAITLRYIYHLGLDDNLLNYFIKKYNNVLAFYKNDLFYNELETYFIDALKALLTNKYALSINIETALARSLKGKRTELQREQLGAIDLEAARNGDEKMIAVFHERFLYLKDLVFDKLKGVIDDEKLRNDISIKYDEYVNSYLTGNANTTPKQYLNTMLTRYFDYSLRTMKNPSYEVRQYLIRRFIKMSKHIENNLCGLDSKGRYLLNHSVNQWINDYVEKNVYKVVPLNEYLEGLLTSYLDKDVIDEKKTK